MRRLACKGGRVEERLIPARLRHRHFCALDKLDATIGPLMAPQSRQRREGIQRQRRRDVSLPLRMRVHAPSVHIKRLVASRCHF